MADAPPGAMRGCGPASPPRAGLRGRSRCTASGSGSPCSWAAPGPIPGDRRGDRSRHAYRAPQRRGNRLRGSFGVTRGRSVVVSAGRPRTPLPVGAQVRPRRRGRRGRAQPRRPSSAVALAGQFGDRRLVAGSPASSVERVLVSGASPERVAGTTRSRSNTGHADYDSAALWLYRAKNGGWGTEKGTGMPSGVISWAIAAVTRGPVLPRGDRRMFADCALPFTFIGAAWRSIASPAILLSRVGDNGCGRTGRSGTSVGPRIRISAPHRRPGHLTSAVRDVTHRSCARASAG